MEQKQLHPLTHPQQRIWYTEKLHPGTGMWNNAGTVKIKGALNFELLGRALNLFIENNEAMRLRITEVDGKPYQYVREHEEQTFDYLDFSHTGTQGLFEWDSTQSQSHMPVLERDLYYFAFVRLGEDEGGLYAKIHHLISDAWTIVMVCNQVMEIYDNLLEGHKAEVSPGESYISYIDAEARYLKSRRYEYDRRFWLDMFHDIPELTVLKQKKDNYFSTRARRRACIIPKSIADSMRIYCDHEDISIFSLYLSALLIYINRILNKDDIVIGVPVFNRTTLKEKNTVGMFVSTVPMRIKMDGEQVFADFVQTVSNEWFRVLKHQKFPYDVMLKELRRDHKGLDNLYDMTLSYQNAQFEKNVRHFSYQGRWHFAGNQVNSLSIHINDREKEGRLIVDYDHLIPLFSLKEIEYLHSHLLNILTDSIAYPEKKLYELTVMPEEEMRRVCYEFSRGPEPRVVQKCVSELFYECAHSVPDEIALVAGKQVLSYAQLDERVNAMAHELRKRGVMRGSIVGIIIGRNQYLLISILAVLRAGGAFLPIDPDFPAERVQFELGQSGAKFVIASPHLTPKCGGVCEVLLTDMIDGLISVDQPISASTGPDDTAYIIYTSGSTGQPKGVMIAQHSIAQFLGNLAEIMDFTPGNVVLSAATISFDLFIMETFPTLLNGGTVVLAGEHEHNIPKNLVRLIAEARVNKIMTTPSRMQLLITDKGADECLKNVREIMMGGDALPESLLAEIKLKTPARIFNFYGPTEVTIAATYKDVTEEGVVNIGRPLPGVRAYILDRHLNPVPVGVHGEFYIGGYGLAKGYLGQTELTEKSFIENPFVQGERLYRTGDLTRWYPMGEIEYLGRIDQQVKIRGFRIELGEIENKLLGIKGIDACAVMDRQDENGRKYLCAYVSGKGEWNPAYIKAQLAHELPGYMIPSILCKT